MNVWRISPQTCRQIFIRKRAHIPYHSGDNIFTTKSRNKSVVQHEQYATPAIVFDKPDLPAIPAFVFKEPDLPARIPTTDFEETLPEVIPAPLSSEDKDEEEWIESGDSLDDIVINEVTDQETDDIKFQVEDLKVGDYILAFVLSTGKRSVVHYKYVAKILRVLKGDDFEVQCLKSLDETKTTFKFIENDQCVIAKKKIFGRLPDPQLVQFERILKTDFPAEVEVYEKS
ncbi:hypothetical protein FQA39_LY09577 [Lamprigera yunnana]|nr:hypothetical protein FQA39_LY09577 [Lamprigera yunnana]